MALPFLFRGLRTLRSAAAGPSVGMALEPMGLVFAVLSTFFNGSFAALSRLEAAGIVHPFVFNLYLALGVCVSSVAVIPFVDLFDAEVSFTWLGATAGLLLVGATSASFVAVKAIGLSTGQGVWGGAAILVAFLWGSIGPAPIGQPMKSIPLSFVAVLLLLIGVIGIVKCEPIGQALKGNRAAVGSADVTPFVAAEAMDSATSAPKASKGSRFVGLVAALCVGLFGGSILVPFAFLPEQYQGTKFPAFLPSFGVGAAFGALVIVALWYANEVRRPRAPSALPARAAARPVLTACALTACVLTACAGPPALRPASAALSTATCALCASRGSLGSLGSLPAPPPRSDAWAARSPPSAARRRLCLACSLE